MLSPPSTTLGPEAQARRLAKLPDGRLVWILYPSVHDGLPGFDQHVAVEWFEDQYGGGIISLHSRDLEMVYPRKPSFFTAKDEAGEPQTSDAMTAGCAPDFSVGNPSDEEILEGKGHSDVLVALVTLSMVFGVLLVGLSIYAIVKG